MAKQKENNVDTQEEKVDTPEQKEDDFYPTHKEPTEEGWRFYKVSSEELPVRSPEEHQSIVIAKAQARIDAIEAQQKEEVEKQKKAEEERKAAEKKIKA